MMGTVSQERISLEVRRGSEDPLPYYCVSTAKFVVLSLLTWGLYEIYWFYANWKRIRRTTGREVVPLGRAIFSIFYCHSLAETVRSTARSVNLADTVRPASVATGYAVLLVLQGLPDPWWLLSSLSFVPLLPIVTTIREIHAGMRPGHEDLVGWGARSYAAAGVGALLSALVMVSYVGPPTYAMPSDEIPASYLETLRDTGVLEPGEQLDYFYSAGFFSILEDGNLLTSSRVVSYFEADGELVMDSAPYTEVVEHEVAFSDSDLVDSVLRIVTATGAEFDLLVSPEKGRDHEFVALLERRLAGR